MLSKSAVPAGSALQIWTSASGACAKRRVSACRSCNSLSQGIKRRSRSTCTRTGRVLMNRPTMDSAPGRSSGRPAAVPPQNTSSPAVARAGTSDQAPRGAVVKGQRAPARELAQAGGRLRAQAQAAPSRSAEAGRRPAIALRRQGRSGEPGEAPAPERLGFRPVLPPQPGDIVAVRARSGQGRLPAGGKLGIAGKQLREQHAERPAVHHYVVQAPD